MKKGGKPNVRKAGKKKLTTTLDGKEYYTYPGGPTDLYNKLQKAHEKAKSKAGKKGKGRA